MQKLKNVMQQLWKDESGQGATEYILLLVVVVGLAVLFKDQITTAVTGKLSDLSGKIQIFGNN